jgi:hypothetical protein
MARRSSFRKPRQGVTQSQATLKKATRCRACRGIIDAGDVLVRLRLKKKYQGACTGCGHRRPKLKYFHLHCVPVDINQAMGFDPAASAGPSYSAPVGGAVPPPPKPQTPEEAALIALSSFEHALKVRVLRKHGGKAPPEMEKAFKTFQGIKARVLRPGTPAEGEVAVTIGLKRIIDLVFG